MNSNNNSDGNIYDSYWNDKLRSPDTSENFSMKIENFSKKEKPKPRLNKDKLTKNTKTIINIPNANFKKNNISNVSIPKPPMQKNIVNSKISGDSNTVPFQNAFNLTTDLEDDTNEGIPIENNNLINMAYKSVNVNNNNLSDINSKNLRLNTEDNFNLNNQNIYNNLLISPKKDNNINIPIGNFNNINSKIHKFFNFINKIKLTKIRFCLQAN